MIGSNYYIMDTLYAKICDNQARPLPKQTINASKSIPGVENCRNLHGAVSRSVISNELTYVMMCGITVCSRSLAHLAGLQI